MDAHQIQEITDRISQNLKERGVSPDTQSIFDKLSSYINDFSVAPFEAERKVLTDQYNQYNIPEDQRGKTQVAAASEPSDGPKDIGSIAEGDWVNFDVKVVSLSEPRSPSISQTGILADSSGAVQFTVFAKATEIPHLEKDKWYHVETATVDSYKGAFSLKIHSGSKVTPISDERTLVSPKPTPLSEIKKPGVVPCVKVKYVQEWESRSERMSQTGLVADASGRSKFVMWKEDGKDKLKLGSVYTIYYATVDEFNGRFSLGLNSASWVEEEGSDFVTGAGSQEPTEELPITTIHDLKVGFASLKVKFIEAWEVRSERMMQTGLVGDETGKIKFVLWKDDTKKPLELNRVYHLKNVKVDEYNGRLSLALNRGEYAMEDENADLVVGTQLDDLTGAIVQIAKGSGVVKRCPVEGCKRVLSKQNLCPVHELQTDFTYDMRIKATLDDGNKAYNILMNREVAEKISGLTLENAKEIAMTSALGADDVQIQISDKIVGRYVKCTGSWFNDIFMVKDAEFMKYNKDEAISLLNKTGIKEGGE